MSDYEIDDERIMLYVGVEHSEEKWIDKGELVRCADCVNWGEMAPEGAQGWCPVVRKCTKHADWCCWGARKGEADER